MINNMEDVNSEKVYRELITPHKVTVAILIREYCYFRDSDLFNSQETGLVKSQYRRDFCVLVLKLLQSPDLTLGELTKILVCNKYKIHESVIESFNEQLSNLYANGTGTMLDIIDTLNRIMTFNESITPTLEPSYFVSKSSIVGHFLRRLIIHFDMLNFSEVTNIYLTFKKYYDDWQMIAKTSKINTTDSYKVTCPDDWSANREQWSKRQAELFMVTQAALLTNNEEKALPPQELQNRINNLLRSNPSSSEAHFLSYLNYLRVKEFCGAINSLYHCFDRTTQTNNKISQEDKNKIYRFATLNVAVLHYHFGHREEALASLKESIKMSQAANDNVCLQHALSWLYRLTAVNKQKLIEHSAFKSLELNLFYTTSLGIQTFVQHACLIAGFPHQLFNILTKGDLINCQNNMNDLIYNSYAVKSALWQFYGKTEMSSLWSQLLFYWNIDISSDVKGIYCEGFCLSVCNLSNYLLIQGNYSLVHAILNFAKDRFPSEPNCHIWMLCENLFVYVRALHHENWNEAQIAAQKLLVINKWEGYLRLAELCYFKQDYLEAQKYIKILINRYETSDRQRFKIFYFIRAKILLAEIQCSCSDLDNVPPGVLTFLHDCLLETKKHYLDYQSALINLRVADIQLRLGMTTQALRVLENCLIQILAHGGHFDRGRAMLLYVKCLVVNSQNFEEETKRDILLQAAKILVKVKENFQVVEAFSRVKDVMYLQSHLYDTLGMKSERNKCALEFRFLDEERTTKNYITLLKY